MKTCRTISNEKKLRQAVLLKLNQHVLENLRNYMLMQMEPISVWMYSKRYSGDHSKGIMHPKQCWNKMKPILFLMKTIFWELFQRKKLNDRMYCYYIKTILLEDLKNYVFMEIKPTCVIIYIKWKIILSPTVLGHFSYMNHRRKQFIDIVFHE